MRAALCSVLLGGLSFSVPAWTQTPASTGVSSQRSTGTKLHSLDIRQASKRVVSVLALDKAGEHMAQGSGFFVDAKGTLVTNHHVIEKASSAFIKTPDGAYHNVEGVLAEDAENDLVLLKVRGHNFASLPLADSARVRVGDRVVAIGSPLGLESTVSEGIVSGLRGKGDSQVIQTTAPMSPGSSGGVLLNSGGQVIAVITFGVVAGQNLNFAIPSNHIRPLLAASSLHILRPAPSEPELSKEAETPKPKAPEPLPREWINVNTGIQWSLRQEEDLLYAEGSFEGDLEHIGSGAFTCSAKKANEKSPVKLPDTWVGQCRNRLEMGWAYVLSTCYLNREWRITSVSPRRIEGTIQKWRPGLSAKDCPRVDIGTVSFTLIPKE